MDPVTTALMAGLLAAGLVAALWRQSVAKSAASARQLEDRIRELEKQLHLKERDFLAIRNEAERAHEAAMKAARAAAFEEGRSQGLAEKAAEHANEMEKQRLAFVARTEGEREQAASDARERVRREYELQSKLFTVKISPYVKVLDKRNIIFTEHETSIGYQYQLLINGIPAFAPHVVVERSEVRKEINEKVEALLIESAEKAADAAIQLYLGGAPQFAKRASPLIERLRE